jgi:hypothetical protein
MGLQPLQKTLSSHKIQRKVLTSSSSSSSSPPPPPSPPRTIQV